MIETDRGTLMNRVMNFARGRGFEAGGSPKTAQNAALSATLMWLAGGGYRPRRALSSFSSLKPASKHQREIAEKLFAVERPAEPVEAAAQRSELLSKLRQMLPEDSRVRSIFDADPIIIEDRRSYVVITESIFNARLAHFDALYALFGQQELDKSARRAIRKALIEAFVLLSPAAQEEWALSEYRLAQTLNFIKRRKSEDIIALSNELRPVFEARGGWEASRLLSHAAALAAQEGVPRLPIADLLELNSSRIAA